MGLAFKSCKVVLRNKDKVNPVTFEWGWKEEELPIVDQHTYLGVPRRVDISKFCSWDAHIAKLVVEKKGWPSWELDGGHRRRNNIGMRPAKSFM